jgi:mRNA interferase HigB
MHPQFGTPIERWYEIVTKANWRNFNDLKNDFNTADYVGNALYVFDIKGNDCRLIARILFKTRTVFIKFIGTHKEYDKLKISEL